ncbi:uncharacterized protein EAF01_009699 [Botrytis porri]|uniref:Uncharacterized protein n=1 Tax=Botrytis porri TaxID=87229 RepID=A0A4Z1KX61_9HELO|nr:uncharacterized protein EAF01_009699 [Botrytis porri]KAF7895737.1 hypothetical protein EAF01_009699 [Botrytis porri]TGO89124.1 hypothetical protein BPOR_0124g00130 [Botrytis porri]
MEIKMTVELPDHMCKHMWGEADGEMEIERGSEEVGNVHGDVIARPKKKQDNSNVHIEAIARPASKTSKGNSNLHSGAVASISQQNRNLNIAPTARPAPISNLHGAAVAPTTQNSPNSNITSNVRLTPKTIQNNCNMHNRAIAPTNQTPANNQNLAPGRTHKSSSSARTTQNPPGLTTVESSAYVNPAAGFESCPREKDRQSRLHALDLQQELRGYIREMESAGGGMGGSSSSRAGSKRSRDGDAGNERRKYPRGDYSSRRN